jgi:branched-chain amino acid transport system permease protein
MSRVVALLLLVVAAVLLALLRKYRAFIASSPVLKYSYYPALILLIILGLNYALVAAGANHKHLWQQAVYGLSLGSVYALIALGYTMVYGIIKLINFAHGDIYMIGAYAGYYAVTAWHLPFIPALIIAMAAASLLGVLVERIAYKPLRNSPRITLLITAIGMSLLIENVGQKVFSATPRTYPTMFTGSYEVFGVLIDQSRLIIFVVTVFLMLALQYFVTYTKPGMAMRAVSQDRDAARLMGINIDKVIAITFAVGSALAGAAGILVGIIFPQIKPTMGVMPGLKAFVAAVIGGIGIIPGALLGGLIIGLSEYFVTAYISSSWRDAIAFGLLILILLIRPSGILGKNTREKV